MFGFYKVIPFSVFPSLPLWQLYVKSKNQKHYRHLGAMIKIDSLLQNLNSIESYLLSLKLTPC